MIDSPAPNRPRDSIEDLPLREWRCVGRKKDGRPCNAILNEWACTGNIKLRDRCDKCGTWNTLQR